MHSYQRPQHPHQHQHPPPQPLAHTAHPHQHPQHSQHSQHSQLPPPAPQPLHLHHQQQHPQQHPQQHQQQHQQQHPQQHSQQLQQQHQQQHVPPPQHIQHHTIHQQPHQPHHSLPHPHQQRPTPRPDESALPPPPTTPASAEQRSRPQQMPIPFSKVDESTGRKYHLDVVQQPRRARMCGFGDKDRRPITPPPCVRLVITDMVTGKEIDCNDIDHAMFVLNVDLWNEDGTQEVNLVRSSTGTPSISSTTPYSYTSLNGGDSTPVQYQQQALPPSRDSAYTQSSSMGYVPEYPAQQSGYSQGSSSYPQNGSYGPPQQFFPQQQPQHGYRGDPPPASNPYRNGPQPGYGQDQNALTRMAVVGGQPQGMFTRNLIGSLAASAFRLSDTRDHIGIWFVLQDLSVRTEGPFRLKFSFVNVGPVGGPSRDGTGPKVNQGKALILASCFSEVFNVYSAKKFPGVCESTALSKTFATQGIKIPIRKDSNIKGGDGGDDDYD
ncbi:velvet factor-domain-containing protein [Dactylonectria macrodidyma]|uniref:Velvet factor-domain-containing protein n=1 Tax=Dactylonectria macrodidyma TaxID=307937 RepID=A0A9P9EGE3_9HYPO|nr:velvet factor-domain-containing protein [Dactylonectria macrodidyma]